MSRTRGGGGGKDSGGGSRKLGHDTGGADEGGGLRSVDRQYTFSGPHAF